MKCDDFVTENVEIRGIRVWGLDEAIICSGYPMRTENLTVNDRIPTTNDKTRAVKLGSCRNGEAHDTWLSGVIIQMDLRMPVKTWVEWGRYHFQQINSSESTVHCLGKMDLEKAFDRHTDKRIIEVMKDLQKKYEQNKTKESYLNLLMSCPAGLMLTARVTLNYQQAKTMYVQRKNHPIPAWRDICKFFRSLELMNSILD